MRKTGDSTYIWVMLKSRGKLIDLVPHLIKTHVTNGYNSWYDRSVETAVCGLKRKHKEGWRSVRSGTEKRPNEYCEACYRLNIMNQLSE